ncbi:MAG: mucoidy inhibitor MuiA family protein [Geobacter sp.]|nr:mucoidy inhibitor MuiA family protein [Geobacter sp.]
MKIQRLFFLLILLQLPALAISADLKRIPAAARIKTVTVYSDRAMSTRSASFNLKAGSYLITFEPLPTLILDDSVRVEGKGTAAATISGLEIKRSFLEHSGEKRVKELDEEIQGLERRSGALDAKKAGISSQKAFLESIRVAWGERISKELAIGRPTSAGLQEASSFVGAGVTKADEQFRELDLEKRNIKDKIDALHRQRDQETGSGRKEVKSVEVAVEVSSEGSLTLELTSITPRASWEPAYDVRLAADTKTADLTYRAMVWQQTGEEWNNVDLTLSTARPSQGGAPPELQPWQISFYRPQPAFRSEMYAASPAPSRAKIAQLPMDLAGMEDAPADSPANFATARISEEQSSVVFHIPQAVEIPSDGTRHSSIIAIEQLPVSIEYLAVPKLSQYVFLKSEIVNRAAYPLLPGKINIFAGNSYTGSSQLKKVAAGEKFDLFFGTDDQLTVKREELKQRREAGIFGKNRVEYRYRIQLANYRKEQLALTLLDQLPLSSDAEIRVSLDEPSIKPDEIKNDGTVVWKTSLQAGEKKGLTFGIVVEYPKEREVSGL